VLELTRGYVAYLLAGYGEPEVSTAILKISDENFRLVQEAANRGALEGKEWLKVACRAAVEIVEGKRRELRRRQLVGEDLPQELLASEDAAHAARVATFWGGARVKKPEIFSGMATAIAPELSGYKYFKARAQYEKPFPGGASYVALYRGRSIVYIGFGVTHDEIERTERWLFGPRIAVAISGRRPKTLTVVSMNIGPRAHYWPHAIDADWLILGEEGIRLASIEAVTFTREVVVPFIDRNQTPAHIRDTLLSTPGRIASLRPAQTVFAIDHLERRRDWLEADLALLMERFQDFSPENREKLQAEYRTTAECWDRLK
jgi:hypothetical protein